MAFREKTFRYHDSYFSIVVPLGPRREYGGCDISADAWAIYAKVESTLRKLKYTFHQDPQTKKNYKSIAKFHHHGKSKLYDVEFTTDIAPVRIAIEFYQDIYNVDNLNGGRYCFDKFNRMSYLQKLTFKKTINHLKTMLLAEGYEDDAKPVYELAIDKVMQHRKELEDFQSKNFYVKPQPSYNTTDRDGNTLKDGDIKYFYDYNGKLSRGTLHYNINNMWWVVTNKFHYNNIAAWQFFEWKPGMPLKDPSRRTKKLEKLLALAVEKQNFEKAIIFRDLLGKQAEAA